MDSDLVDANLINPSAEQRKEVLVPAVGAIKIPINSLSYDMTHKQRGKCLIFNHETFDSHTGCRSRPGTDRDANALTQCFSDLQFEVIRLDDLSLADIKKTLNKESAEDHTNHDCIVVAVLTHGGANDLWARNAKYPIDILFGSLTGDSCPSLIGKPKIFLIQACRGEDLDHGVFVKSLGSRDEVDSTTTFYRIPTIADFLVYYSTPPGHYSFRNTEKGSVFIQTLVSVLKEYCNKYEFYDLITLLTIVNQKVAYDYESYVPSNAKYDMKKQIPCISSMLTRLIYLTPK